MKRFRISMLLAIALLLAVVPAVFAAEGAPPQGTCPRGFESHHIGMHEDHGHMHVGLTVDLNDDHSICVREVAGHTHVHVDNVIP